MLKIKNKFTRRIIALALSGAMIASSLTAPGLTAYAAQDLRDTQSGYHEDIMDSDADNEDILTEEAAEEEGNKDTDKQEDAKKDNVSEETKEVEITEEETLKTELDQEESVKTESVKENASKEEVVEVDSTEKEEVKSTETKEQEKDEKVEDVKASTYTAPSSSAKSSVWANYEVFRGSVFGYSSDTVTDTSKYTLKDDNGEMHIVTKGGNKIALTDDGRAMYFYQVPIDSTFTLKATAKINSIGGDGSNDSQAGFGLMARDDMFIDEKIPSADTYTNGAGYNSDYVTAGILMGNTADNAAVKASTNGFSREGRVLNRGDALEEGKIVKAGEFYDLSIIFDGTKYTCQINNYPTKEYEISLDTVDSAYQYIGMFAARKADISFSKIYLEVDGKRILDQVSPRYSVTVSKEGNGTIKADSTDVIAGDTVTLTVKPDSGYYLDELQILSGDGLVTDYEIDDIYQFVMPEGNVSIKAIFKKLRTEWDFSTDDTIGGKRDSSEGNGVSIEGSIGKVAGLTIDAIDGKFDSTNSLEDGYAELKAGTTIIVPLAGECTLTVVGKDANYTVDEKEAEDAEDSFTCGGIFVKTAVITATADTGIKKITVTSSGNEEVIIPETPRKIDVWDFGAKEQLGTNYVNHIKASDWNSCSVLVNGAFTSGGNISFGDLTIYYSSGDRIYSNTASNSYHKFLDKGTIPSTGTYNYGDYTAAGEWYCHSGGGAAQRYVTIENVAAGDIIDAYVGISNVGEAFVFEYLGADGTAEKGDVEATVSLAANENKKLTFVAKHSGVYKIWTENVKPDENTAAGKPLYNRIVRRPAAVVQGSIDWGDISKDGVSIQFINDTTNEVTNAAFDRIGYVATLTPGYTYTAKLVGKEGYGFTESCKKVTVSDADGLSGKTHNLVVEEKISYKFSGKVTGFDPDYDLSNLAIRLKSSNDNFILDLDDELNYEISLERNLDYAVTIEGANDYDIAANSKTIKISGPTVQNIEVVKKTKQSVSGKFIGSGEKALTGVDVTKLVLKNLDDDYVYEADTTDKGYSLSLRKGTYIAEIEAEGYSTRTHVTVNNDSVTRDLFLASTDTSPLPLVKDLYVNYPDKEENNFDTINAALKAAKCMNPQSEADRITIHIYPGTYREQVFVNTNYITLINDMPDQDVKITWYYGIAYAYYSIDETGYYNEEYAYDKYEKHNAARWGCAVRVKATDFKAKNIIFENSFNRYITDEEIKDGVVVNIADSGSSISYVRKSTSPVSEIASNSATERAAALALDTGSDRSEFYNCQFLGSQDTLYTGDKNSRAYYKNCFISGNTDYIFGDGNQVFENCELNWQGYTKDAKGGHITAAKDESTLGYLFYNCTITKNKTSGFSVAAGTLGRPWGAGARVTYVNTVQQTNSLIADSGWAEMSGKKPANANYKEYNTTTADGTAISYSKSPRKDIRVTTNPIDTPQKLEAYFGDDWMPTFYTRGTEGGDTGESQSTPETGGTGESSGSDESGETNESESTPVISDNRGIFIEMTKKIYEYTGDKITPDFDVVDYGTDGVKRILTQGVDYTVTYKNNKDAGEATIIVKGKGNYASGKGSEVSETFTIKMPEEIEGNKIDDDKLIPVKGLKIVTVDGKSFSYDGNPIYPRIALQGTDYTYKYDKDKGKYVIDGDGDMNVYISVSNNVNKGNATILVTGALGSNNKPTQVKAKFKITPVDLSKAGEDEIRITTSQDTEYAVKGAVPKTLKVEYRYDKVADKWTELKNGRDYTVKYANNKKAGLDGTITITGKGNYAKKCLKQATYPIKPLDLKASVSSPLKAVTAYEGIQKKKVKATVVDRNGTALKASQYTIKIYRDVEIKDGKLVGTGEYADTDPLEKGKIYVQVVANDANLESETDPKEFSVGTDISKANFKFVKGFSMQYTGNPVTLTHDEKDKELKNVFESVTIKVKENGETRTEKLNIDTDYEIVSYENNINKGTATAVIAGKDKYSGTKTVKFKITQQTMVKGTDKGTNAAANLLNYRKNFVNNLSN